MRSILSLVLVVFATFLVSCSGPNQSAVPPTYSSEQIAQLKISVSPVLTARDRMPELEDLIVSKEWVDTDTFIHGPLGQLRRDMSYVSRSLLKEDQGESRSLAKEFFGHIEAIGVAAKGKNLRVANQQYNNALEDLEQFISLVPEAALASENVVAEPEMDESATETVVEEADAA
ncbi:MAG: photosystem II protein PsbQ [Cyanobacteria bacterium P01_H01_bin.15]